MITQQELDELEQMSKISPYVSIKMAAKILEKSVAHLKDLESRITKIEGLSNSIDISKRNDNE